MWRDHPREGDRVSEIDKEAILSRRVESIFDEDRASASVPVASAVVGRVATLAVRDAMVFRAFHTRARTGMQLTRAFKVTVAAFNVAYGQSCKSWADVLKITTAAYAAIEAERKGN